LKSIRECYNFAIRIFCMLILFLLTGISFGQINLPACQGNNDFKWNNCLGNEIEPNGDKYLGEYKDGKYNGQETYLWANGDKYVGKFK
jgi:hypothetical protein